MGTAKNHCKTQDILTVGGPILGLCWPILGLCWPILRAMWAHLGSYVGPSWGCVGPSWGYVGPSWGPFWGLCCPILGAMLPHLGTMFAILRPMLTHLEPQAPKKAEKNGRAKYPVKRRIFWRGGVGRRQGVRPLSPTERRELPYGKDTARGPLAGFMRLTPDSRAPAKADPSARAGFEFDPGGLHLGRGCAYRA